MGSSTSDLAGYANQTPKGSEAKASGPALGFELCKLLSKKQESGRQQQSHK